MADILTVIEAARYLCMSKPTLDRWRYAGEGPDYLKLMPGPRGPIRYRREDLDAWLASKLVGE